MDLQNRSVLIIGDSHSAGIFPFGPTLSSLLSSAGAKVHVAAVGGTAIRWWVNAINDKYGIEVSEKKKQIAGKKFDLTIIAMGTNDAANAVRTTGDQVNSKFLSIIRSDVQQMKSFGLQYSNTIIWVGPPRVMGIVDHYIQDAMDGIYKEGYGVFGSSNVIDSRKYTPTDLKKNVNSDGVHILNNAGKEWAQGVFKDIKNIISGVAPSPLAQSGAAATQTNTGVTAGTVGAPAINVVIPPEGSINSGVVNKQEIKKFEKLCIKDDDNITIPTIDITSTVRGYIKNKIESIHRENYLKGKHIFYGTVFRVPSLYKESNYDYAKIIVATQTSIKDYTYKVRVPEIDGPFLEIPSSYDGNEKDKSIIDLYDDFTAPSDIKIRIGDKVEVTYADFEKYKSGKILRRMPETMQDKIIQPVVVASSGNYDSIGIPGSVMPGTNIQVRHSGGRLDMDWADKYFRWRKLTSVDVPWNKCIATASSAWGVPINLIKGFISVESGWNPNAQSPANAKGLIQIIPSTWNALSCEARLIEKFKQAFGKSPCAGGGTSAIDPKGQENGCYNIFLGTYFISKLLVQMNGDVEMAAAGYNGGPGVGLGSYRSMLIRRGGPPPDWRDHLPTETKNYIVRVPSMWKKWESIRGSSNPVS